MPDVPTVPDPVRAPAWGIAGLFPWNSLEKQSIGPSVKADARAVTVTFPYQGVEFAPDAVTQPLAVTVRTQDLPAWTAALAEDPTRFGTQLLEQWIPTTPPKARGRHARRAVGWRTLRLRAAEIYLTLERWAAQDLRVFLAALKKHARERDDDIWGHMERRGRWHLSLLTAYVIEQEFPQAFKEESRPTSDPKAFYEKYIRGRQLRILRPSSSRRAFPRRKPCSSA